MASLSAIRYGLKTRLDTIDGLRAHDTVPEKIEPPAAIVVPQSGTYNPHFGGGIDWEFHIQLFTALHSYSQAQDGLDPYVDDSGDSSVKAAIEGDVTLGGIVSDAQVTRFRDYRILEYAGVQHMSVVIVVEVMA